MVAFRILTKIDNKVIHSDIVFSLDENYNKFTNKGLINWWSRHKTKPPIDLCDVLEYLSENSNEYKVEIIDFSVNDIFDNLKHLIEK